MYEMNYLIKSSLFLSLNQAHLSSLKNKKVKQFFYSLARLENTSSINFEFLFFCLKRREKIKFWTDRKTFSNVGSLIIFLLQKRGEHKK